MLTGAVCACLVVMLIGWAWYRHVQTVERRALCRHDDWEYRSLDNYGVRWNWCCNDCGAQEPYRVTIPPRAHPDNPLCIRAREGFCECSLTCAEDRSRTPP